MRQASLSDQHRVALDAALAWLPEVVAPTAIVATGSIMRGDPHAASDLDLVVLHDASWRRRVQRWFNGTPVEIFINSEAWLRHCIDSEAAKGRPVMAHMLATGELVRADDGRMAELQAHATAVLARGPNLGPDALLRDRYAAATLVEDALDMEDGASPDAQRLRALAVDALLRHEFLRQNRFLPRQKERFSALQTVDRALAHLLASAMHEPAQHACAALRESAERILGTVGFFEWDSGPDASTPGAPPE